MGWLKRVAIGVALAVGLSSATAEARRTLNLQYETYKNPNTNQAEVALKVPVHKGISYYVVSMLYTGSENNVNKLKAFNGGKEILYDKNIKRYVYVPIESLKPNLRKIFQENRWTRFEIDSQGDDEITSVWDIATAFLKGNSVQELVNILLAINDDINPINAVVYNGQFILVPRSLVDESKIEKEEKPKKLENIKKKKTKFRANQIQNPIKADLSVIKKNLKNRDKYGASRLRSSRRGYKAAIHKGLDIVAPIGTSLYPIKSGIVLVAGKGKGKWWRNGNYVTYRTDDGLVVTYIHLKEIAKGIRKGVKIGLDTELGRVGITGNASANNPHVHIQVKRNGKTINPYSFVVVDG